MNFKWKITKHLFMLLFVVLPIQVVAIPVLAVVLLFIAKERETLPRFVRWFDNNDAHREGLPKAVNDHHIDSDGNVQGSLPRDIDGLAAPDYWRKAGERFEAYPFIKFNYFKNWWSRLKWLAFRNPINYFKWNKLGFIWNKDTYKVLYTNNRTDVDNRYNPGLYRVVVELDGKEYFEWYYVSNTYQFFGARRVRIRIGWKLDDPDTSDRWHGELTSWVFAIGFFKRIY